MVFKFIFTVNNMHKLNTKNDKAIFFEQV